MISLVLSLSLALVSPLQAIECAKCIGVPSGYPQGFVFIGTSGPDVYIGTDANESICTLDGDDSVEGLGGNDFIDLGCGNDVGKGGEGADWISGGAGDDEVRGNGGNDRLNGNSGNDIVYGGQGDDIINGGQGDDQLFGQLGNDILQGDLGNDSLSGGAGVDQYVYRIGDGHDTIEDYEPNEIIHLQDICGASTFSKVAFGTNVLITISNPLGSGSIFVKSMSGSLSPSQVNVVVDSTCVTLTFQGYGANDPSLFIWRTSETRQAVLYKASVPAPTFSFMAATGSPVNRTLPLLMGGVILIDPDPNFLFIVASQSYGGGATMALTVPIPVIPSLIGASVFVQGVWVEFATGLTATSNALVIQL